MVVGKPFAVDLSAAGVRSPFSVFRRERAWADA